MKKCLVFSLIFAIAAPVFAQDALDLHTVALPHSPPVADWAQTVKITQLDMDPRGGIALTFDAPLPERWKFFPNPAEPTDNFQFTVWACVQRTYCAGFIEMWQGRSMTDGSIPAILGGYTNWWGDARHLWDSMSDYVPQPGDEVDVLVTAGNGRLVSGITSVAERSNVVAIKLPAGDSGHFLFGAAAPLPTPTPTPAPVIIYVPAPPTPPAPVVVPQAPIAASLPALDLSGVYAQIAVMAAKLDAVNSNVTDSRAENKAFNDSVKSVWAQLGAPILKYVVPAVAAWIAAKKL
jgi:hypothetical protein